MREKFHSRRPVQHLSQATLLEAEATLRAIRTGEIDAVVVEGADGPRIYSLHRNDQAYRSIVEHMSEGAAALDTDGLILYCNRRFAEMLGSTPEALLACDVRSFVAPADLRRFGYLMETGRTAPVAVELALMPPAGPLPVYASAAPIELDGTPCLAMVASDLSARQRSDTVAASQEFARSILDQATEPVFVCDRDGVVTHASHVAELLCGPRLVGRPIAELPAAAESAPLERLVARALAGEVVQGVEVVLGCDAGRRFLGSGGPLRDAHARIVGCVVSLVDITALKSLQTELEQARDQALAAKAEADRANVAKSKFLAAASHDLRQPAQSLVLLGSVLKTRAQGTPLAPVVAPLEQAIDALNGMLNSLLDVSRLDAGVVSPQAVDIDLRDMLDRLGHEYALQAGQRGLTLRWRGCENARVRTDPALIERILRNLIENALKYTREGGVLIACRRRPDGLRLDIVDTGTGIAEEHHEAIFEEFVQLDNPARDRARGLGLGLAIVRRLATLIGARIAVRSRTGRGSRFTLTLPFEGGHPLREAPAAPLPEIDVRTLLVIDDEPIVRLSLQLMLEGWGHRVLAAGDAAEAVAAVDEAGGGLDAIIADYRLADNATGIEAVRAVHRRAGRAVPALILTGDTAPERIQEVHASGLTILHKPVDADALKRKVVELLRKGHARG